MMALSLYFYIINILGFPISYYKLVTINNYYILINITDSFFETMSEDNAQNVDKILFRAISLTLLCHFQNTPLDFINDSA